MFQHPPFPYYIPHALRTDDCAKRIRHEQPTGRIVRTLIFSYVFERKGKTSIFALDYAHHTEASLSNDPKQPEVVQVDYWIHTDQSGVPKRSGGFDFATHLHR